MTHKMYRIEISHQFLSENEIDLDQFYSISDVLEPIGSGTEKFLKYWRMETVYIDFIISLCDLWTISSFVIDKYSRILKTPYTVKMNFRDGYSVNLADLDVFIRSSIREEHSCRLKADNVQIVISHDMFVAIIFNSDVLDINLPKSDNFYLIDISELALDFF